MNTELNEPKPIDEPQMPESLLYSGMVIICSAAIIVQTGMPLWGIIFFALVLGFMFYYRSETSVLILLILAMSFKLMPQNLQAFRGRPIGLDDVLFALVVGGLMVFAYRFIELNVKLIKNQGMPDETEVRLREGTDRRIVRFGAILFKYPFAILLGFLVLALVPWMPQYQYYLGLKPEGLRAIILIWMLAIAAIVILSVLSILGWRKLTRPQATIHLHRVWAEWIGRDLLSVERRRVKQLAKKKG